MPLPKLDTCPFDTEEMGIVISCESGILWTNQAGGGACAHPEEEGVFVPLGLGPTDQSLEILRDRWHVEPKHVAGFLASEELDDVLEPAEQTVVGGEAWVPVRILDKIATLQNVPDWAQNMRHFPGHLGFLVYQNSD